MRRMPIAEPRRRSDLPVRERWFCSWCYAWTELGHHPQEVSRPQYRPMHRRWERAEAVELPEGVGHAYDEASSPEEYGTTLCGIRHDGLRASAYPWVPDWPDACRACREAAAVIDQRWPPGMRGEKRVHPTPPPGSHWPPF
ncbi:hypothetical protein C6361_05185 [Plantactinospora sp. BC1]|nr:hypothetical protein C6361_05185 [Plantactinospora sp. BC1]